MKQLITVTTGCCLTILSMAQEAPDTTRAPNNAWIEPMSEYIQLKITQTTDIEKLAVVAEGAGNTSQFISPNAASVTHLGLSYKFLSFGYSFIPKFLPGNDDDDIRGRTKGGGFNLDFNFAKWQQELAYGTTKGYYLENTKDYVPGWQEEDPYVQLPNLKLTNIEGLTAYKFNPNYSLNAVATQSERQLRSAGTFMPALLYRYYVVDDKTVPTGTLTSFKSRNVEVLLGAGYYHTFVLGKSFYLSLGATPAIGFINTKFFARTTGGTEESTASNFIFRWDTRGGLGYNGKRFFAGAYLRAFGASNKQYPGSSAINTDARTVFQLFAGYRLRAPKWLKQNVEKVESFSPL